jgi:hypothetical protein
MLCTVVTNFSQPLAKIMPSFTTLTKIPEVFIYVRDLYPCVGWPVTLLTIGHATDVAKSSFWGTYKHARLFKMSRYS